MLVQQKNFDEYEYEYAHPTSVLWQNHPACKNHLEPVRNRLLKKGKEVELQMREYSFDSLMVFHPKIQRRNNTTNLK